MSILIWIANPHMGLRKKTSFCVTLFLIILGVLVYSVKRKTKNEKNKHIE
ncbi:cytochrome c1 [Bartonella sp. AR 15-3]